MGHETLITKGKRLSFLLRHDTEYKFDKNGWREIKDLIKNHNYAFTLRWMYNRCVDGIGDTKRKQLAITYGVEIN